jgi:hypothetical protein
MRSPPVGCLDHVCCCASLRGISWVSSQIVDARLRRYLQECAGAGLERMTTKKVQAQVVADATHRSRGQFRLSLQCLSVPSMPHWMQIYLDRSVPHV